MRDIRVFVLVVSVFAGRYAAASPDKPVEVADVMRLLQGYEWHLDQPAFASLGEGADDLLMAIARDDSVMSLYRDRAAAALSLYPNDDVWDFYAGRISSPLDAVQRRRAVDAMCDAFVGQRDAELNGLLNPLLLSDDVHLRIRAAKCLQLMEKASENAALEAYKRWITAPWELRAAGFKKEEQIE